MPLSPDITESDLIRSVKRGDAEAYGLLYDQHVSAVYRYLYIHLSNRQDAEDLTSEVFLRAWQSLPNYDERGVPFLSYLFRVARNALIDHYRRNQRMVPELTEEMELYLQDLRPGPAEIVSKNLENQELHRLLRDLREDYQAVLVLRFISNLTPEEIAEVMERSVGAVRVLQHRALNALRKLLRS
jgi:RNA polymerase sigma-70 factor (ECF subfamily)